MPTTKNVRPSSNRHSRHQPHQRRLRPLAEAGFSIAWALIVAFGIILSALAVASRTFFGNFAAVNQQDTRRAREAAEIGASRVLRELNRERNRMLLAKVPANNTAPGDDTETDAFWSAADVDTAIDTSNRCAATPPVGAARPDRGQRLLIGSGGAASTTIERPVVYVSDAGVATASNSTTPAATSPNGESYAYRLRSIWIPENTALPGTFLNARWPAGAGGKAEAGVINLRVQGFAYNNGRLSGSVRIEQQVEVVPKCCGQSLGGNNNSKFGNDSGSCITGINNVSNGLVIGTGLTSDGDIDLTGKSGSITAISGGAKVTPITCVGTTTSTCPTTVDVGTGTIPVVQVNDAIPPVPSYPLGTPTSADATAITKTTNNSLITSSGSVTTINARDVSLGALPTNCGSEAITVSASTVNVIHCRVTSLDTNNTINVISSATRWIRFYFLDAGKVINLGGDFNHCSPSTGTTCPANQSDNSTTNPLLRLQLYGSPSLDQDIIFRGNSTGAIEPFFAYFPKGTWTLDGSGSTPLDLRAMLWVNVIDGKGNTQIEVPGSGIGDVINFLAGGGTNSGQGGNPTPNPGKTLLNDFVARAVRQFRLLPGL